jgi:hypothetical protein
MRTIAELNLLLRVQVELPKGLRIATDEFREGWNFAQSVNACQLEKEILKREWNFIRIGDGSMKNGVGDTSQEAITSALQLVLRKTSEQFNAIEVKHIGLTQYPWFFLARVGVYTYRIQRGAFLFLPDDAASLSHALRRGRLPRQSDALFPRFASAMPQLKKMLISPQGLENHSL